MLFTTGPTATLWMPLLGTALVSGAVTKWAFSAKHKDATSVIGGTVVGMIYIAAVWMLWAIAMVAA